MGIEALELGLNIGVRSPKACQQPRPLSPSLALGKGQFLQPAVSGYCQLPLAVDMTSWQGQVAERIFYQLVARNFSNSK